MRFKKRLLILGLGLCTINTQATDEWAIKTKDLSLSKAAVEATLQARGFSTTTLDSKTRQALLQELFIRESLLAKQVNTPLLPEQLALLDRRVDDFRKGQLSQLILDTLALEQAPDFEPRAKELYAARQTTDYQLPLRLRVRVLEKTIGSDEAATRQHLEQIKAQVTQGRLDFKTVVLAESEAGDKRLTEGDSFWFHQGQKVQAFYEAAKRLSPEHRLSEVFVYEGKAYLLEFIGRQEAMQQTYAEVKDKILAELKETYAQAQRKLLLEQLRTRFSQAEIAPAYQ